MLKIAHGLFALLVAGANAHAVIGIGSGLEAAMQCFAAHPSVQASRAGCVAERGPGWR